MRSPFVFITYIVMHQNLKLMYIILSPDFVPIYHVSTVINLYYWSCSYAGLMICVQEQETARTLKQMCKSKS